MRNLPEQLVEQDLEDVNDIDNDIDSLFNKFIKPIDAIRSIAETQYNNSLNQKSTNNFKINTFAPLESRVHAFYRLLGLPVLGEGNFYSPGFDPIPKNLSTVKFTPSKKDFNALLLREQQCQAYSQMFQKQGFESTLFALLQRHIRSFNSLNNEPKTVFVEERNQSINQLKKMFPDLSNSINDALNSFRNQLGFSIDSARHLLKPFSVNSEIDFNVMPVNNRICVPFLPDLKSTKISFSPEFYLLRPGIELIARARLKDVVPNKDFLNNVHNIMKQSYSGYENNASLLRSTIEALVDQNNFNDVYVDSIFSQFTDTQVNVSKQLIKTLKTVVTILHNTIIDLDKITTKITFLPLPDARGIEFLGNLRSNAPTTKLEKDLVVLEIKKVNADRDLELERNLGNFATAGFTNLVKTNTYVQQIEELSQLKNNLANKGLKHLRTVEIITGEASGLGLIDVIAVYTALWTIDIEYLLGLMDQNSLNRLYDFNINLRSPAVINAKQGTTKNIQECIFVLEQKVMSILTFADTLFQNISAPQKGDPT